MIQASSCNRFGQVLERPRTFLLKKFILSKKIGRRMSIANNAMKYGYTNQHSHLDQDLSDMQEELRLQHLLGSSPYGPIELPPVNHSVTAKQRNFFYHTTGDPTGCDGGDIGSGQCELDWKTDPIDTMQQLRTCLLDKGNAVLTLQDSSPSLLLDAVSLLYLLNQDLRLEEDNKTIVLFQPSLRKSHNKNSFTLLVKKAQAPEMLQYQATHEICLTSVGYTAAACDAERVSMKAEVVDAVQNLTGKLDAHGMAQLKCAGPRSLIVAFKALKECRRIIKREGSFDLVAAPHIIQEKDVAIISFSCWRRRIQVVTSLSR
ncbi:hypothetical protein CEUSTIGMA_g5498.t1 [Chlamydomonas eustigma]|uniref:Uncharacterized protein n=1 Tax=Chlamydomonas eustigma TaxID=1157962 RepID=A0A250X4S5_9CHLO|nr:hypothetical protein CEUSTIGMA_g5498.t1 [Chlamydomonas eustigma]|eukprot:GAX78056.1 hypothetical protein CEUSTIGMA_g5498.t1 [Chlamydomonas eustigma]